jgi:DNA polymerase I-like protein with 3'-5' exonuclease and polymerase domains
VKILLILSLSVSTAMVETDECPSELVLKVPMLSKREKIASNEYAQCMMIPFLPLAKQLEAKRIECASRSLKNSSKRQSGAIRWIDQMATNFAGCETNLKLERK